MSGHVGGEAPCAAEHLALDRVDDALLGTLVRDLADAVVISDADGAIVFWNAAATALFGWDAGEAVGQSLDLIVPEKHRARHWAGYRQVMATGETDYAGRLLEEDARLASLSAPLAAVKLMQMAPTPSFALDRNKHLVRVNDEFVRYLRTVMARTGPVEKAQLRLDRPADAIFAELEIGTATECGVSIQVDNHERRTQARIVIPPPAPASVLVGFILS